MTTKARIVFMGTPRFAVDSLQTLVSHGYDVLSVVTQPDRPFGRRGTLAASPVKEAAIELGLPVLQPAVAKDPEFLKTVRALDPDVCITAAYGQILTQRFLDIPRAGCLNIHASLLPRWRGAAPIERAIMAGDRETGVTVMQTVRALDAGPMLVRETVPIDDADDAASLYTRLSKLGAELILKALPLYVSGELQPTPQPEDGVTYAQRILREDEFILWDRPVEVVRNHIRALCPDPGATTWIQGKALKIRRVGLIDELVRAPVNEHETPLGRVMTIGKEGVYARCSDGWLRLDQVQPSGKKAMPARDWFRGLQGQDVRFEMSDSSR